MAEFFDGNEEGPAALAAATGRLPALVASVFNYPLPTLPNRLSACHAAAVQRTGAAFLPQQRLYFWPEWQGHEAFLAVLEIDWVRFVEVGEEGSGGDWVCFVSGDFFDSCASPACPSTCV